jgi:hypothetical protein
MDVLAEHRELLREVAIAMVDLVEAVTRTDPALRPAMEWMRAAAADGDVVARALIDERLSQPDQIRSDAIDERPRQCADLDHAFGDFKLDLTKAAIVVHAAEQIGRAARQVEIAHGKQLQLKLDPQGQRLALFEIGDWLAHATPSLLWSVGAVSPARTRAKRQSTGPVSSMIAAANSGNDSDERPISG